MGLKSFHTAKRDNSPSGPAQEKNQDKSCECPGPPSSDVKSPTWGSEARDRSRMLVPHSPSRANGQPHSGHATAPGRHLSRKNRPARQQGGQQWLPSLTCVPVGRLEGHAGLREGYCGCAKWAGGRGKARRQDVRAVAHEALMTRNSGSFHDAKPLS